MSGEASQIWHPRASARCTSRFICIETESDGITDPKGRQHLLPPDTSDELLGLAVLDALSYSRRITWLELETLMWGRHGNGKERYEAWTSNLQQRYGYKSRTALFKNMKLCGIKRCDDKLFFTPMVHVKLQAWQGARNDGIEDVEIYADNLSQPIGAALRLAFSRCV